MTTTLATTTPHCLHVSPFVHLHAHHQRHQLSRVKHIQDLPSADSGEAALESFELLSDGVDQVVPHVEVDVPPSVLLGDESIGTPVHQLLHLGLSKLMSGDLAKYVRSAHLHLVKGPQHKKLKKIFYIW